MSLSVRSLFSFFPFKVEGKREFELCQSRSRHYHVVTANVHEHDLYGRTILHMWTQTISVFEQNMDSNNSGAMI
jgi:hypothetical protein